MVMQMTRLFFIVVAAQAPAQYSPHIISHSISLLMLNKMSH